MVLPLNFISGPFFTVPSLTNYFIPNWVRTLVNFHLFKYFLASIIKIIFQSFCFYFLISRYNSSLHNILGQSIPPLALWYLLCWEYIVTRPIDDAGDFTQGWYVQTILYICPLFTSALSNTIFPSPSYLFPTLPHILKKKWILIYLYLPPFLYNNIRVHCVFTLH